MLLVGPAGAGKGMLVHALPTILPQTEVPCPFRAAHFSLPRAAFIGEELTPGELTLAHGGVLFLEDVSRFDLSLLAAVQHAIETHQVAPSEGLVYPAHFLLAATMKPCPCGFYRDQVKACHCTTDAIFQYYQPLQSPLDACFDLSVRVPIIREDMDIRKMPPEEPSASIRQRVEAARTQQQSRYAQAPTLGVNADLDTTTDMERYCRLDAPAERLLTAARRQLHFTPFDLLRTLRVARTIADLAGTDLIAANHLAEAISYRLHTISLTIPMDTTRIMKTLCAR